MLATLIRAGQTLKNQGVKQSVRGRYTTESGTWRRCRVRRLDVLRAAVGSGIEVEPEEACAVVILLTLLVRGAHTLSNGQRVVKC